MSPSGDCCSKSAGKERSSFFIFPAPIKAPETNVFSTFTFPTTTPKDAEIMSTAKSMKDPPRPTSQDDPTIPIAQRKTMTTLLPDDCRWPIGDPQVAGFHFCGKRKQDGHPYCEFHVRRARTPSRARGMTYRLHDAV